MGVGIAFKLYFNHMKNIVVIASFIFFSSTLFSQQIGTINASSPSANLNTSTTAEAIAHSQLETQQLGEEMNKFLKNKIQAVYIEVCNASLRCASVRTNRWSSCAELRHKIKTGEVDFGRYNLTYCNEVAGGVEITLEDSITATQNNNRQN